jgi:hypothetical protein
MRLERGLNWMACSVCETRIDLVEPEKNAQITEKQASILTQMDNTEVVWFFWTAPIVNL